MCGLAGWIGPSRDRPALEAMTGAIDHRGPDGHGHEFLDLPGAAVAAFGHRRLSIIDLPGGAQPMASHDGRLTVIYNGEIYNYVELRDELAAGGARFATSSDTEVILEAWRRWGPACLRRFRGMFAFALHDAEDGSVALARDAFGKKPLFLAERSVRGEQHLVFASEVGALLRHPLVTAEVDEDALHAYLCWRYVPGPHTLFRGVTKLPPGSVLLWKDGRTRQERYWTPPETLAPADRGAPPDQPVEEFCDAFDEAVRLRLRADVPVGAFLSGGLDSSAVVATLAHLGASDIRTFSVGFRGDTASELPAAAATARRFGTEHTPVELQTDALTELLPRLSRHRGAPIAETADLPIHLMAVEASRHVKVVLSGEGADELFGGYPKHQVEARLGNHPRLLATAGRGLLTAAAISPGTARRVRIAGRAMAEPDFAARMVRWFGALTPSERASLWRGRDGVGLELAPGDPGWLPFAAAPDATSLGRVLHFDQTSWLPDNLLERMDRMTMAASIEGRTPFLDVRLADLAGRLPDSWKIRGTVSKRIVREALGPRLPDAVVQRPKNGFRMPVTEWFRGPLHDEFRDLVLGRDAVSSPYLDRGMVEGIADDHAAGRSNHDKTLWALYALEIFLRQFSADAAVGAP